jgi:hypothetical protein
VDTRSVIETYVRAWHEDDEAARRRLLEQSWAGGGVYADPRATVEGRDALVAHIAGFRQRLPGGRIELRSAVDEHGPFFRFARATLDASGNVLMEGVDFGELDGDGRIARIVGFFGPLE